MARLSLPLSSRTRPVPDRPVTVTLMVKVVAVLPLPLPLLPPGTPLQEVRKIAVRIRQARPRFLLAGIIEILFSFVLRPSQAMAGNSAFASITCTRIDGATSGLPGTMAGAQSKPKNSELGILFHHWD